MIDIIVFLLTPLLAIVIRLDPSDSLRPYQFSLLIATILFLIFKQIILQLSGFYKRCWRYASIDELVYFSMLMGAAGILEIVVHKGLHISDLFAYNLPRSIPVLDVILSFLLIGGIRLGVRAADQVGQFPQSPTSVKRLLVVGAGNAGVSLVQKLQRRSDIGLCPVAFIDDDPTKQNLKILGLPVMGDRYAIPHAVRACQIDRIVVAMPTAPGADIREIVEIGKKTGIPTSTLPGIHEILGGQLQKSTIREIQIEDLLRREPIKTDVHKVANLLQGKRILITGSGGSIGSELCRQILRCSPAEILLLGKGENSIFTIQQELERSIQALKRKGEEPASLPLITAQIADIRSLSRLEHAFTQFRPEVIFHAAAHKHVPLMELNAPEAITGNVMGTKNLVDMALKFNVEHLVMISTDKAVNPTNIMGASKRAAEMVVLQAAKQTGKSYTVVRFGNVLGSRGSVVPTFKQQIAAGGPITITHPDICRYFMTIPEAVQLVLQASVLGRGGEVLMLDMGNPVKIVDLAKDLIRLSGYEEGKDIDIVYTGLRPGEKLYEELFIAGEQYIRTEHEKILVVQNASSMISSALDGLLARLSQAASQNDSESIRQLLQQLVPEYTPQRPTSQTTAPKRSDSQTWNSQSVTQRWGTSPTHSNPVYANTVHKVSAQESDRQSQGMEYPMHTSILAIEPMVSEPLSQLAQDLQQALDKQELIIHYQPIKRLDTNKITGFEAFIRWQHPQRGLINSAEFLPIAEVTNLIIPIGQWVIWETCRQLRNWEQHLVMHPPLTVSVNLSEKQLLYPQLVSDIAQALTETGLEAHRLRLEVAEQIVVKNPKTTLAVLAKLKDLGVELQIDNVGIGYSTFATVDNLQYLAQFLHPRLKIGQFKLDRSLINQMEGNEVKLKSVRRLIKTIQGLGVEVVATGIETLEQIDQLVTLNCNHGQGYFLSKPVASEVAGRLIGTQR